MKQLLFGNTLILLAIAILVMVGFEILPSVLCWAAFVLLFVGLIMAFGGYFSKDE